MSIVKTFDRDDCLHYKRIEAAGCCRRKTTVGVCSIPDCTGNIVHKTCSMRQSYCVYLPKEEIDG